MGAMGIRHLLLSLLLLCLVCTQVYGATLEYTMRISDPASHYAHIKTVLRGMSGVNSFTIWSHRWDQNNIFFENYSLVDEAGNNIGFTHRQESESFVSEIVEVNNSNKIDCFVFEYDVHYLSTFNNNLDTLHAGILEDRAIFDMQHLLFNFHGATVPFDTTQVPTTIIFDIPQNWRMATSWEGTGNTYSGTNNYILMPTPSCGDYLLEETEINGLTVRMAAPNQALSKMPVSFEELKEMIMEGIKKMQAVFGNPSATKSGLADRVALIGSYQPMATQESGHGTAYFRVDDTLEGVQYSLTYALGEILRLWYGDGTDAYWVRSTMWKYELYLNMNRLGYKSTEQLNQEVKQWSDNYQTKVLGTKYDVPIPELMNYLYYNNQNNLSEEDRAGYQTVMDNKGPLFWVCINGIIKEKTGGAKDIYDFSATMNREFAGDYTINDIIEVLNNLTGWDFTGFFQDHYYGNAALDTEPYLSQ